MASHRIALAGVVAALAVAVLPTPPADGATRKCSTFSGAGGDVLRVYALRGVSCKKALAVAKAFSTGDAPSPWHCLTGTGQKYQGKALAMACGYGSRGPVRKRKHAFVAVQEHSAG
jgi:hypothetical protein